MGVKMRSVEKPVVLNMVVARLVLRKAPWRPLTIQAESRDRKNVQLVGHKYEPRVDSQLSLECM